MGLIDSPEYEYFEVLRKWSRARDLPKLERSMKKVRDENKLFDYLYKRTKSLYAKMAPRKDGEDPFLHPLNLVLNLQRAKIDDEITLCGALIHDYVEEKVDLYRDEKRLDEKSKDGIKVLDQYEDKLFLELEDELVTFAESNSYPVKKIHKLIGVVKLLTRHKRDFYYRSISDMFTFENQEIKEMAIQIKLADRIHNILCISCFNEKQRIYQCFKNLFILNSTKKYLLEKYGEGIFTSKKPVPTERLFNKCCKATYDAFFKICELTIKKGVGDIVPMLQLSFKKYALEQQGISVVTNLKKSETHLVRLFQGVIRKYDARLHHEWDKFERRVQSEIQYSEKFFKDFKFNKEQIHAILDYKDAYALREIVTYLLYRTDYVIQGFEYSGMFRKL